MRQQIHDGVEEREKTKLNVKVGLEAGARVENDISDIRDSFVQKHH